MTIDLNYTELDEATASQPAAAIQASSWSASVVFLLGISLSPGTASTTTYDFRQDPVPSASDTVDALIADIVERSGAEFRAVNEVRRLLSDQAQKRRIRVVDTSISRFVDPEESAEELVITQRVVLSATDALAYWDDLGVEIVRLTSRLSPAEARIIAEGLAVNVEWEPDAI
jgi:hypothetical protein